MNDRALIRTGTVGRHSRCDLLRDAFLAVLLPLAGLGAWLASADLVAFSLLAVSLGLIVWGLYPPPGRCGLLREREPEGSLKP